MKHKEIIKRICPFTRRKCLGSKCAVAIERTTITKGDLITCGLALR